MPSEERELIPRGGNRGTEQERKQEEGQEQRQGQTETEAGSGTDKEEQNSGTEQEPDEEIDNKNERVKLFDAVHTYIRTYSIVTALSTVYTYVLSLLLLLFDPTERKGSGSGCVTCKKITIA